jgi:hypothetical protein
MKEADFLTAELRFPSKRNDDFLAAGLVMDFAMEYSYNVLI